jgi:hypothetical protein
MSRASRSIRPGIENALGPLPGFAVIYEVRVSPQTVNALPQLKSDLHANILDVFNERGVQTMIPAYETDPDKPKIAPAEAEAAAPDAPGTAPKT